VIFFLIDENEREFDYATTWGYDTCKRNIRFSFLFDVKKFFG